MIQIRKLLSVRLWVGAYLLSYGVLLEIIRAAPQSQLPYKRVYEICIFLFAFCFARQLTSKLRPATGIGWYVIVVVCALILALGLFYLPWIVPTYFGQERFGWSAQTNQLLSTVFRASLIVAGICILFFHFLRLAGKRESK